MMLTLGVVEEASAIVFGLDGRRPRRPFRLSVRTTRDSKDERKTFKCTLVSFAWLRYTLWGDSCYSISISFCSWHCKSPLTCVFHAELWFHKIVITNHSLAIMVRESVKTPSEADVTFFDHSHCKTFLETTELAAVPPPLVHWTVFISQANIFGIFLHSSLSIRAVGGGGERGGDNITSLFVMLKLQ